MVSCRTNSGSTPEWSRLEPTLRRASLAAFVTFFASLLAVAGYSAFGYIRATHRPASYARLTPPDRGVESVTASNLAKRLAAQRVFNERLPLLAAAELFREASGTEGLMRLGAATGAGTLRERLCRQVIQYVYTIETGHGLTGRPPEWSYSAELWSELECLLAAGVLAAPQ